MITLSPFAERLLHISKPTPRGVVGLVDDLLILGREHPLRFHFQDDHCDVYLLDVDTRDPVELPLAKSVFRAALARVATLCNQQIPNSVTPYRGESELSVSTESPTLFHVKFTNTPAEQNLEVKYIG